MKRKQPNIFLLSSLWCLFSIAPAFIYYFYPSVEITPFDDFSRSLVYSLIMFFWVGLFIFICSLIGLLIEKIPSLKNKLDQIFDSSPLIRIISIFTAILGVISFGVFIIFVDFHIRSTDLLNPNKPKISANQLHESKQHSLIPQLIV